jgi:phosphoglucomutase
VTVSTFASRFIPCPPFTDQRPGTAGLRRRVAVFQQQHYLEMFIQAALNVLALPPGATLVLGGDGRFHNRAAAQAILRLAAANGIARVIVGRGGLLSTPAASHLIRKSGADGGFLLTASHNPGGPDGDFGVKFNTRTGGQAPEELSTALYQETTRLTGYRIADLPAVDLDHIGTLSLGPFTVEVVDPVAEYVTLLEGLFDFGRLQDWVRAGHRLRFDAMHGITGPYARRIFVDLLGCSPESVVHGDPREDFGGLHPDPNPVDGADLVAAALGSGPPDLLAASDGDGDRNMILGPGCIVSPGDSVAVLLDNLRLVPGYRHGVPGVARSMPTSRALDVVAAQLGLPCYETPTGWRFFCNLLEAGRIGLCGEESFGTGSSHVREKDGLWAVLMWLSVVAATGRSVGEVLGHHWARYGRHLFQRHDYTIADATRGDELVEALRAGLPRLAGTRPAGATTQLADDFTYHDPVDGSESAHQGIRVGMDDGTRIVYRLSGTGTSGATLRVYLEQYVPAPGLIADGGAAALAQLGRTAARLARIADYAGSDQPSMVV